MTSKTYKRKMRFLKGLAFGLAVAAIGAPGALADGRSPDTMDAVYASQSASLDGRSPDTLDAVSYSQGSIVDGRSPDTLDSAFSAALNNAGVVILDGRSPDTLDSAITAALNNYVDGRSPDTLDAVSASTNDNWLARAQNIAKYAQLDGRSPDTLDAVSNQGSVPLDSSIQAALNNGGGYSIDGRSADTLDAVSAAQASVVDGRSADTRYAAYVAHEPVVTVSVSRFDWSDAGIGFGAAFGIALLGIAMFALRRQLKPGGSIGHASAS